MLGRDTSTPQQASPSIRVLVVDDSAFMRFTIVEQINKTTDIRVVGTARDGREALNLIPRLQPDVVTLDIEMPVLDGLSTLREIMIQFPRPVIMFSSLTSEGAVETIQALTLGAVDFITKPDNRANVAAVMDDTISKIRQAATAKILGVKSKTGPVAPQSVLPVFTTSPQQQTTGKQKQTRQLQRTDRIVVIGSSTGGPRALNSVVPMLNPDLSAAYLIVQHMPAGFTRSLADRLDVISGIKVKEAEPGDRVEVGRALLAPGGFHMVVDENGVIALNKNQPVHGVRPAVDVTMISAAKLYKSQTIGVILTGMGRDGTTGCSLIHGSGGKVIAEDESTCVVWGMPRSVFEAGVADEVVPIQDVSKAIEKIVRSS